MSEFYRLVVDFEHEEVGDEFQGILDALQEAIILILDPPHPPGTECARDWYMNGGSVTDEYRLYKQMVQNAYVGKFKEALEDVTVEDILASGEEHDA